MRFIRTMKKEYRDREEMWAGHTAPFFRLQKSEIPFPGMQKRPAKGLFYWGSGAFQRSRCSILPGLPSHSAASGNESFFSVMFGQTSASSTFN